MSAFRIGHDGVLKLTERNGAPRHDDDKTRAIVRAVTEELLGPIRKQHREEIQAVLEIASRMEQGYSQLARTLEAFAVGDQDVAVASVTDGESAELPHLPRYKADATVVYKLAAKDIGIRLGLPHMVVSYFLGPSGLDWLANKPSLWNQEFFRMTRRRLWHPHIVDLLAGVILNVEHEDRQRLSESCAKKMDFVADVVRATYR
jgi:hypothetical protein